MTGAIDVAERCVATGSGMKKKRRGIFHHYSIK